MFHPRGMLIWALLTTSCRAISPEAALHTTARHLITEFAVIGDYGIAGPDAAHVAALVQRSEPEFIVTLGDNNYPEGDASTLDENVGQYYHDYIEFDDSYHGAFEHSGAAINRFFPALGNHDWGRPHAQPYIDYFKLPGNERYYQFTQGPIDFFVVDSDPHEPDGDTAESLQGNWLREALANSEAAWKIVVMHHPPYSSGDHGSSVNMRWPFKEWGASIVLTGHDHVYERIVVDGLTYVICGFSGAPLVPFVGTPNMANSSVDIGYDKRHGACFFTASDTTLEMRAISEDNETVDTCTLSLD